MTNPADKIREALNTFAKLCDDAGYKNLGDDPLAALTELEQQLEQNFDAIMVEAGKRGAAEADRDRLQAEVEAWRDWFDKPHKDDRYTTLMSLLPEAYQGIKNPWGMNALSERDRLAARVKELEEDHELDHAAIQRLRADRFRMADTLRKIVSAALAEKNAPYIASLARSALDRHTTPRPLPGDPVQPLIDRGIIAGAETERTRLAPADRHTKGELDANRERATRQREAFGWDDRHTKDTPPPCAHGYRFLSDCPVCRRKL